MANPYFCYVVAYAVALLLYPLGWSTLYPPLSLSLLIFIVSTIGLHIVAGVIFPRYRSPSNQKDRAYATRGPLIITVLLYVLWTAEFLYAGGVPLVEILLRNPFDYKTFGIPTLHVFVVTFSSFYTIFLFQQYIRSRSPLLLTLFIINISAAILIYNRGMFLFNVSGCIFLFLTLRGGLRFAHGAAGVAALVLMSYLFGVMGSLRVSNESRTAYTNEGFLNTGSATTSFRTSIVPDEFFWSYVYATSPLANLQQNINSGRPEPLSAKSLVLWLNNEVLPDFISKRVNAFLEIDRRKTETIPGPFNATTIYSGSYTYAGWPGMVLMAVVILLVPIIYLRILPPASPFFLPGLVIVNTIFLFMIFDNTIRFTGLSFQVVYPILLHFGASRIKWIRLAFCK